MKLLLGLLNKIEVGARRPLLVRRENVEHIGASKRLLFASDLHLRKDGPRHIVDGLLEIASRECPDLILLGGDLVDGTSGLEALQSLAQKLSHVAVLCAVAGNHDRWIGTDKVRAAVMAGGGRWLEDAPWFLTPDCAIYGSRVHPTLKWLTIDGEGADELRENTQVLARVQVCDRQCAQPKVAVFILRPVAEVVVAQHFVAKSCFYSQREVNFT